VKQGIAMGKAVWEKAISYIEATPAIRDVIISGGDPLMLPDDAIVWLLTQICRIPHVEMVRIGTKMPIVLPQRITHALVSRLKAFKPLYVSLHVTHPKELTPEMAEACDRLADAGICLGSQTVLLKGINDSVQTMKELMHGLLKNRVKPYYLFQCDPIFGSGHFRTPVSTGLRIIEGLQGHTSGYAVPNYVIDTPGGGGKVRLLPQNVIGETDGYLALRNYEGKTFHYPTE
jgi:lysine 2,3-aminomutase